MLVTLLQLLVAVVFLASPGTGEAASPLVLSRAPRVNLAGHMEFLVDPSRKLVLEDVLSPAVSRRFIPLSGNLNKSYTRDTVWLRFSIVRELPFPDDAWLRLGPPFLDYVTVYLQTGDDPRPPASYREIRLGDHVPVAERPAPFPEFVAPIHHLPLEKPVTAYVRVQSTSVLTLSGAVHTPADIIRQNNSHILFQAGYLSAALTIALIHLVIFLRTGDKLYLYFSSYIAALFVHHLAIEGIFGLIWPARAHLLSDYLVGMGNGAVTLLYSLFAIYLFQLVRTGWAYYYFTAMAILGGATMLSVPGNFYGSIVPFDYIGALGAIMLLFWLSIRAIVNKTPGGGLYLAAFGISNVGYGVQLLRLLGLLPLAWWNNHAVQIASLLNMVLMTLALTERLRAAEHKALQTARESEQKAVELAEEMTVELRDALAGEQQALERQTRFLTMLSHEYRTPLAIIRANLDLLKLQQESGLDEASELTTMKHAVNRLVEVMEVSLQTERLNKFRTPEARERIELTAFLDEIIDKAEGLWPDHLFVFQPEEVPGAVMGDAGALKTAFLNLLDNACKYSPPDMPVTIECHVDTQEVVVAVHDRGKGITPGEADKIFEKYYRGHSSSDTSGAGLGLWLVRQIVERFGGAVSLEQGPGGGTVATVRLPAMPLSEFVGCAPDRLPA